MFKGYRCESGNDIFTWRATLNYPSVPHSINPSLRNIEEKYFCLKINSRRFSGKRINGLKKECPVNGKNGPQCLPVFQENSFIHSFIKFKRNR